VDALDGLRALLAGTAEAAGSEAEVVGSATEMVAALAATVETVPLTVKVGGQAMEGSIPLEAAAGCRQMARAWALQ